MAEYINREDVYFHCSYNGECLGLSSDCEKCSDNVIDYQELMEIPTADVVERDKIDKAIEEITNLRRQYPNEDYYDCKWEILAILKKNIGVDYEHKSRR